MRVLAIVGFVLLGLPSIAACNDEEAQAANSQVNLYRLLNYPFTGPIAWGVRDLDIEERIIKRFGEPLERTPSEGQIGDRNDIMLEYDSMTFLVLGTIGHPNKIIQGIIIKDESAPLVYGIRLGQHISTLPFDESTQKERQNDGISVRKFRTKITLGHSSEAATYFSYDGLEYLSIADGGLTISFDDDGIVSGIEWRWGTGH